MSTPPQTCIYIPTRLVKFFRINPDTHEIDIPYILNTTTAEELSEIITAVRPRISLERPASGDHEFVKKVFTAMVATELENLRVLDPNSTPFIRVPFRSSLYEPEDSLKIYTTAELLVDGFRHHEFKFEVISDLRGGRYQKAGNTISKFIEKYTYLTKDELSELELAKEDLEEHVDDDLVTLKKTHKIIQASKSELRKPDLSQSDRKAIQARVDGAYAMLKHHQEILDRSLKDAAFMDVLFEHHQKLRASHHPSPPQSP